METCAKHSHERGLAPCRRCGGSWCANCLIYSFGPNKPPFCMACAMFAGGVRSAAKRPALPRRELKALQKAIKAEAKADAKQGAKAGKPSEPEAPRAAAASEVASPTPAPATSDWETPWWEDRQPTFSD